MTTAMPAKILLVEDARADAFAMLAECESLSAEYQNVVTHVSTLVEALPIAKDFDIVIADLSLPDSDGVETIERLRSAVGPAGPQIFVYSASQDHALMTACGEAGATAWFPKGTSGHECLGPTLLTASGYVMRQRRLAVARRACDARIDAHVEDLAILTGSGRSTD